MTWRTEQIRNVALMGHSGSGKTSLSEALLFKTKAISRLGRVEDGTTTSDWDPEEHRRTISVNLSVVPVEFKEFKINILDTPGYLDFGGEVVSALHVAEAALILVDAVAGCEVGTELAWDRLEELGKPRIFFINKMDRENADFQKAIDSLRDNLTGTTIIPLQLPVGQAHDFKGVVSLVTMQAYMGANGEKQPIPPEMQEQVDAAHTLLIEAAAEADDELIIKYLDGEELTPEEVRHGLLLGVLSGKIAPVYCGSATRDVGLERLLSAIPRYVPSPDYHPVVATRHGSEMELRSQADGPLGLAVFKTTIDRYVGRMNYVRNFSGTLDKDSHLVNSRTDQDNRISNLFKVNGKDLTATDTLTAGDIGVITKLEGVLTGDTLSLATDKLVIPAAKFAQPLYSVAVAPATKADSAKMGHSLSSITEEDPTLRVEVIPATHQTLLHGMGETHLDVAVRRLEEKFGVKVETNLPRVPYQETISRSASAHYRHKKQTGGSGQFGEVHMRVEPLTSGSGFEYSSEVFGGAISGTYLPSIEKGVRQIMDQGVIAGYPVVDIKAVVFDGKEHPVDSKDIAFQTAGREAFRLAVQQAEPVILEPIYRIAVIVPDEYMGDVMGDFNTRRGRVQGMEQLGNRTIIRALVPLAEVMRYGTDLRSMTQGRGTYELEFDHYDAVPKHLAEGIIAQHKVEEAEHA